MAKFGKAFKELGGKPKRNPEPIRPPRGAKLGLTKSLNYEKIKVDVLRAIENLPKDKRQMVGEGTLPEMMVSYALAMLGYIFQAQRAQTGGRLRLGGSVVDNIVYIGASVVAIRVQGDYWHSLPERKAKDAVQLLRLQAQGHRVFDAWEHDIYQAWVEGRILAFVDDGIKSAA